MTAVPWPATSASVSLSLISKAQQTHTPKPQVTTEAAGEAPRAPKALKKAVILYCPTSQMG